MEALTDTLPANKPVILAKDSAAEYKTDTAIIKGTRYALTVYKMQVGNDACFMLEKEVEGEGFRPVFKEPNYTTTNSNLFFADYNHDGFADIIWTKRWQDHAYLFNPQTETFVEVGEFHHVNTLQVNGRKVLYQGYPLQYLVNEEKDYEWVKDKHSELFIIDSSYHKISFATVDNMSTLDEKSERKLRKQENVLVTCSVPPYYGRFDDYSMWNMGQVIDQSILKATQFDDKFIERYWQQHYQQLLAYGEVFAVRAKHPLEYSR
ncbi:hypothetical protein FLA_1736 [Filimonas lacunae]|nr:hypothetical protein FLA_1736 [Filimonas lacunae]